MLNVRMESFKIASLVLTIAAMAYLTMLPDAVEAQSEKMIQKVLLEKMVELASKQVNVKIRHITFPVGFKTPEHTHKGPGPRYVLKGQVEVIEGGETKTVKSGEVFWESGIPMTAENVGDGEAELIVIELLPVD
jgi:quercetin dioxygenase-like cupin family protein